MFERLDAPEHVIAIRLSGKLTADDFEKYRELLQQRLTAQARIDLYVDFTGLSDMTGDALIEGAKADLALLARIEQLRRCALVSDKDWLRAVTGFLARLFPTVELKVFAPGEGDEAMAWVAVRPEAPEPAAPAIRFIPTSKDNVLAFEINGVISGDEMPAVIAAFEAFLGRHETVRLLNRMTGFAGIDPAVFMQGGLVSMKLAAMQKVERYAIVGAPDWMAGIVATLNPVFGDIDMRTFPAEREPDAWAWLGATPSP